MTQTIVGLIACLAGLLGPGQGQPGPSPFWGALTAGPHEAGLKILAAEDDSRPAPATAIGHSSRRPMRIYLWYPAQPSAGKPLTLADYARQAELDLPPLGGAGSDAPVLPTALARGMKADRIRPLLASPTRAFLDAPEAPGSFPVLVLGQGLYYESPLANFVLCEYLASHGYIVATCPLLGTRHRLTNLNVEDLETQVRDMEFALARGLEMKSADRGRVGAIGFDLGGMSGLLLAMRNPGLDAYLSLDSGILVPHPSGLPGKHPSYHEDRLRIPWMHASQARFLVPGSTERKDSLYDRKIYGDSYLVHVPTTSHGDLSSYAMLELENPVPGYWGARDADPRPASAGGPTRPGPRGGGRPPRRRTPAASGSRGRKGAPLHRPATRSSRS